MAHYRRYNHAQGVALRQAAMAPRQPSSCPPRPRSSRSSATQHYGGTAVLHGDVYDEAEYAMAVAEETATPSSIPSTTPQLPRAKAPVAMEIAKELPLVDYILVPIGARTGHGIYAGQAVEPDIKVIGVEPANAACMKASWKLAMW